MFVNGLLHFFITTQPESILVLDRNYKCTQVSMAILQCVPVVLGYRKFPQERLLKQEFQLRKLDEPHQPRLQNPRQLPLRINFFYLIPTLSSVFRLICGSLNQSHTVLYVWACCYCFFMRKMLHNALLSTGIANIW